MDATAGIVCLAGVLLSYTAGTYIWSVEDLDGLPRWPTRSAYFYRTSRGQGFSSRPTYAADWEVVEAADLDLRLALPYFERSRTASAPSL
jgi:hypothetical protein